MEFSYPNARLPNDDRVCEGINEAAARLHRKLSHLSVDLLDISEYNKRYLGAYLGSIRSALQLYSYLLSWSVAFTGVPLGEFVFIDYGGGSGLLSLLAKEFGVGTVIYNDIYDVSCNDAKLIGQAVQDEADYYVRGDLDELIDFLRTSSIRCNAIASYDVIEHIYDIEEFLSRLHDLSNAPFNVVLGSGANSLNPRIRRSLMREHRKVEYTDRERKTGHKERDSLRAYFSIRKAIISHHAPALSAPEVEQLAEATRGLIESGIVNCTEEYLRTGIISCEPDHPTNTCDPYTGNWMEHLMDIGHLEEILSESFEVGVLSGYYGSGSSRAIKNSAAYVVNFLLSLLGRKGLILAPYFVLYARKTSA